MSHTLTAGSGADVKLSLREKLAYGAADTGYNLVFNVLTMYLMFYYTDVAGLDVLKVGTLFLVVRLLDIIAGPLVGELIDKTHTRWGKVRPWFLWFSIPFAITGVLVFSVPRISPSGKLIWAYITYILISFVAAGAGTPTTAILPNLTTNQQERVNANAFRNVGGQVGVILSGVLTLPLVGILGRGNQQLGFTLTMLCFGVISVGCLLFTFFGTRERVITAKAKEPPFTKSFSAMMRNLPWWLIVLLNFVTFIGVVGKSSSIAYFFKYNVGNAGLSSVVNGINSIGMILGMILTPFMAKKMKKRNIVITFFLCSIVGSGILQLGANLHSIPVIMIGVAIASLSGAGSSVGFVMLADVVDYGEWKTGIRGQGLITSCATIGVTAGAGIAGWLTSFILAHAGFVANRTQTATSLGAISFNFIWLSAICSVIGIIIMLFYRLDDKGVMVSIHKDLATRNTAISVPLETAAGNTATENRPVSSVTKKEV